MPGQASLWETFEAINKADKVDKVTYVVPWPDGASETDVATRQESLDYLATTRCPCGCEQSIEIVSERTQYNATFYNSNVFRHKCKQEATDGND